MRRAKVSRSRREPGTVLSLKSASGLFLARDPRLFLFAVRPPARARVRIGLDAPRSGNFPFLSSSGLLPLLALLPPSRAIALLSVSLSAISSSSSSPSTSFFSSSLVAPRCFHRDFIYVFSARVSSSGRESTRSRALIRRLVKKASAENRCSPDSMGVSGVTLKVMELQRIFPPSSSPVRSVGKPRARAKRRCAFMEILLRNIYERR